MSIGELTSFIMMSIQTGFSAVSIGPGITQIYQAMGAVDRIYKIIDADDVIEPSIPSEVIINDPLYKMM